MDENLPLEIERTYLLDGLPSLPEVADTIGIEQGYLPEGGDLKGRLRRELHADGAVRYTHTIKSGSGLVRSEQERTITQQEWELHWPQTEGRRLSKIRYLIESESDGLIWEVDVFDELELVLAEVELPNAETVVTPPPWLLPHIVREVTDEKQYCNYELALRLARTRKRM